MVTISRDSIPAKYQSKYDEIAQRGNDKKWVDTDNEVFDFFLSILSSNGGGTILKLVPDKNGVIKEKVSYKNEQGDKKARQESRDIINKEIAILQQKKEPLLAKLKELEKYDYPPAMTLKETSKEFANMLFDFVTFQYDSNKYDAMSKFKRQKGALREQISVLDNQINEYNQLLKQWGGVDIQM